MFRFTRACVALLLVAAPALATTWTVDASGGPGSQFTDIGTAILAASPGDVILVRAGTYPAFVTSKGLTILGQGNVLVNGQAVVVGVPAGERTAIVALAAQDLVVDSCDGPVLVQEVGVGQMRVISSPDVRCRNLTAAPPSGSPVDALTVESSRVELVSSNVRGSTGITAPEPGGSGIHSFSSGRLHVVASTIVGGNGTNSQTYGFDSGAGGSGILLEADSHLRIAGGSVTGGYGGFCQAAQCSAYCHYDAPSGVGIASYNLSTDHYSSSTAVTSPPWYYGIHCILFAGMPFGGTGHVPVTPDDPILTTAGTPTPGQLVSFTVSGQPGAPATLWLGRGLVMHATPPVAVEELVPRARVFNLGPIPASGTITRNVVIQPSFPAGFGFAAQAEIVLAGGEIRRTSSCPIVVR